MVSLYRSLKRFFFRVKVSFFFFFGGGGGVFSALGLRSKLSSGASYVDALFSGPCFFFKEPL